MNGTNGQTSGAIGHLKKLAFLKTFAQHGIVSLAAEVAGIARSTHYEWLKVDREYGRQFKIAEQDAADAIEAEMHRRAVEGLRQYRFTTDGKPLMWYGPDGDWEEPRHYYEDRRSDALLIVLAKARRPERFRERYAHEVSGSAGGPLSVVHANIKLARLVHQDPDLAERLRQLAADAEAEKGDRSG